MEEIIEILAVEILMLFDKDASIQRSFYVPREYGCNGHGLSEKAIINFDSLIEYMATREFFNMVKEGQDLIEEEKKEQEEKRKRIDEMIKYMNNNLEDERYASVKGIVGVKDILLNKKLNYYDMSIRQRNYVDGVYKYMQEIGQFCENKNKKIPDYIYYPEHNDRYLKQCLYNLQEKADRGIITEEEWKMIEDKFGGYL